MALVPVRLSPIQRRFIRPVLFARLLLCGAALLACSSVLSADTPHSHAPEPSFALPTALVRIELTHQTDSKILTLLPAPGSRIMTDDGLEVPAQTGTWTITRTKDTLQICDAHGQALRTICHRVRFQGATSEAICSIGAKSHRRKTYRGVLEIAAAGTHLLAINELPLETYLRGVIPCEMGHAPEEALKAQAVAARTFAVNRLQHRAQAEYDLRDSTDSQVYGGAASETAECDRAVAATEGLILTSGRRPIDAQYCADCGGMTASGAAPEDCLPCVHDDDAHGPKDRPNPPVWTVTVSAARILRLLHYKVPPAVPTADFPYDDFTPEITPHPVPEPPPEQAQPSPAPQPTLEKIEVVTTDASGRAKRIRCTVNFGPDIVPHIAELEGETLRRLLGANVLRSLLFRVECDAQGRVVFTGRGWGHGRGLCQTGAMALAAAPLHYDFRRILSRYYAGATLSRLRYDDANRNAGTEARHGG